MKLLGLGRTAVAVTAVLAMSGLVAGCGDSGSQAGGGDQDTSTGSSSTHQATNASLTRTNFVPTVQKALRAKKSVHMTMSMGQQMHATGDADYGSDGPQLRMKMTAAGQQMEMRFVDGALYMQAPGMGAKGKFIKITKNSPVVGQLIGKIQSFGPNSSLAQMKTGLTRLDHVGSTTIGGMKVEHYRATVDTSAMLKKLDLPKAAAGSVPKKITEDLYVGPGNLLRRTVVDVMGQSVKVDLTHWGEPVHITAPPASQVMKMPKGMIPGSPQTSTGGRSVNG